MLDNKTLQDLLTTCQFISQRGLSPATGGNFSVRVDINKMFISASGKDKSQLHEEDFVVCDFQAQKISGEGKPSAEGHLHGMIYALSAETQCVLHTHSVPVTLLSLLKSKQKDIIFQQYEMQKSIRGIESHEQPLHLTLFENDQDMVRLSEQVKLRWQEVAPAHGLLVRGHGLYSWGNSIFEAKRHMEGLEFMVQCELLKSQVTTI